MAVSTLLPTIKAVESALTSGLGSSRTIPSASRFALGLYPDKVESISSPLARQKKLCEVRITEIEPLDPMEMTDKAKNAIRVAIDLAYYLGHEGDHSELRSAYSTAAYDFHLIRSVLCFPGNLTVDGDAAATGLAGGALISAGATWRERSVSTESRLLLCEATFPAIVELTFPT